MGLNGIKVLALALLSAVIAVPCLAAPSWTDGLVLERRYRGADEVSGSDRDKDRSPRESSSGGDKVAKPRPNSGGGKPDDQIGR